VAQLSPAQPRYQAELSKVSGPSGVQALLHPSVASQIVSSRVSESVLPVLVVPLTLRSTVIELPDVLSGAT